MSVRVKYYNALSGLKTIEAYEILKQEFPGVKFSFFKPGFFAWGSLEVDASQQKYRKIIARLSDAGMQFERRKPPGAW